MKIPKGYAKVCEIISGHFSGWLIVAMMCVVMFGVVTRYVARRPFGGSDELSVFLMMVLAFMGLAYTWKERGHIRITFFVKRLPIRVALWLRFIVVTVALAFTPVVCWAFYRLAAHSWQIGTKSVDLGMPLAWPQMFMFIGSALLFLWLLIEFARAAKAIRTGETEET